MTQDLLARDDVPGDSDLACESDLAKNAITALQGEHDSAGKQADDNALARNAPKLEVPESAFCNLPSILIPRPHELRETPELAESQQVNSSCTPELSTLEACLHDLAEAEARWGADHACVAQSLRRMAYLLASQGRRQKALPLWIRVLEIEGRYLGSQHPDVIAAETWIRSELDEPSLKRDAAIAYAEQLANGKQNSHEIEEAGDRKMSDAAINAAATAGGVAMGTALNLGIAAASSTSSLVMDATGHVAHFALRKSVSRVLGVEQAELVTGIAASAGSAARESTRRVSTAAVEAVQTVGVSAAANATSSALTFAGHKAFAGTAWAASGARRVMRRFTASSASPYESATAGDSLAPDLPFGRTHTAA